MHTKALRKWALLLTFWVALQFSRIHAQGVITGNTVSGDLTVTGNSDLEGGALTFGTNSSTSDFGSEFLYTDGTSSILEFDASRSANLWKWQQNGSGTLQLQMTLDSSNNLSLYDASGTATVYLSATSYSTFSNSVTMDGTNNRMPHQSASGPYSVLTESLGDARYLSSSSISTTGDTLSFNSASATGPGSFSEGFGSTASGASSVALGTGCTASGYHSIAFGMYSASTGGSSTSSGYVATASGGQSVAMGSHTTASGVNSVAMGGLTLASGSNSVALGFGTTASGYYTTALGNSTSAYSYCSLAIGQSNIGNAYGGQSSWSWQPTDPLFEIGNGTPARSASASYSSYYSPTPPTGALIPPGWELWDWSPSGTGSGYYVQIAKFTSATTQVLSDALVVYKNGNAKFQGTVTSAPGGDIPMFAGY